MGCTKWSPGLIKEEHPETHCRLWVQILRGREHKSGPCIAYKNRIGDLDIGIVRGRFWNNCD